MWNIKALLSVLFVLLVIQLFFGLEIAQGYDDEMTLSRSPNLFIPDATQNECGSWVEDFLSFPVPQEAIVLYVDITFTISHFFPSDLVVLLQCGDDTNAVEILWNMDGQGSPYTRTGIWSFYGLKATSQWKLRVRDCSWLGSGTLVSWSVTMCYHVPPEPPSYVWASTGTGPREVNVSWYRSYDPQCGQYWVEWNRNYQRLVGYDETEGGIYARSCDSTSKTVNGLRCVEQYYFRVRTVSVYGANIMGRPSFPPAGALSSYCQDIYVSGKLKYVNYDDQYAEYSTYPDTVPMKNALVTFWDASGNPFATLPIYTNSEGYYIASLSLVDKPIYMKFQLINQDSSIGVYRYGSPVIINTFSDTLGPDNAFYEVVDESLDTGPRQIFGRACYSFDYLQRTGVIFQPADLPPVQILYDPENLTDFAGGAYDTVSGWSQIYLTSRGSPNFMYRLTAPVHECAHNIHRKAWNKSSLQSPLCLYFHYPNSVTSEYCAVVEGWAEFLSCVPYSPTGERKAWYLKHSGGDLESNDWWKGEDGTNKNGAIVEGAVASAWYDMEDLNIDYPDERSGSEYYDLASQVDRIFDILKTNKPRSIAEFMNYWHTYPGLENWERTHLVKIFAQHQLFMPGDANSDGTVTVADVVFLVNYLFKHGPAPSSPLAADANGDCYVTVGDVVYLVAYLFKQGPEPFYGSNC